MPYACHMPSYKTKSVILKTYNLGEADRIVKLFARDRGPIDSVAKGARKIKSKFGGRLVLYNFIECEISKGKSLDIITQAEIIKNFKNISSDFNKFLFCQLISEIILRTNLAGAENAPVIFKLLYLFFNEIDKIKTGDIYSVEKTALFFISKFLKLTGYAPMVASCVKCGAGSGVEENSAIVFSIKFGGVLCKRCASNVSNYPDLKTFISKDKFDFIKKLFSLSFRDFSEVNINLQNLPEVLKLIGGYMRFHTGCNLDVALYVDRVLP